MNRLFSPFLIILGVVLILILGVGGCLVSGYNSLVEKEEQVEESWSQVDTVLQRRAELIPNLVETVQGYADHEREVFDRITQARSQLAGAGTPEEAMDANAELSSALGRLMAIREDNPELQASENFTRLQDELAGAENRIAVQRQRYNEAVSEFNAAVRGFPRNVLANMFDFETRERFQAEEGAREAPEVSFD